MFPHGRNGSQKYLGDARAPPLEIGALHAEPLETRPSVTCYDVIQPNLIILSQTVSIMEICWKNWPLSSIRSDSLEVMLTVTDRSAYVRLPISDP